MTQRELDRALAKATGESVRAIRRMGFSILDPKDWSCDLEMPDSGPQTVDWDVLDLERMALAITA